jgi:hypothetical protein
VRPKRPGRRTRLAGSADQGTDSAGPRGRALTGLAFARPVAANATLPPHPRLNADAFYVSGASSDGVSITVAADQAGLRMLRVGVPSGTNFSAVLSGLGLAAFETVDFASVLTLSDVGVVFVPSVAGNKCEPPLWQCLLGCRPWD